MDFQFVFAEWGMSEQQNEWAAGISAAKLPPLSSDGSPWGLVWPAKAAAHLSELRRPPSQLGQALFPLQSQ